VVALVEAILAFIALVAVAALCVRPVITGICMGNWRFLGMSPIILLAVVTTITLLVMLLDVIHHLSMKVANSINLRNKLAGLVVVLALVMSPMSLSYLVVTSFTVGPITDDPIDYCGWAAGQPAPTP
jgi:hypothetical protein